VKTTSKKPRNPNIADVFYPGGHSQTAIVMAYPMGNGGPDLRMWNKRQRGYRAMGYRIGISDIE
jgi:hypothetical protein